MRHRVCAHCCIHPCQRIPSRDSVREGEAFEVVLVSVRAVAELGLEVCCTLGMLSESQALRLKQAALTAYNHNLDASPEFYGEIITTRVYQDRLNMIASMRKAGIAVCCGSILSMGESDDDALAYSISSRHSIPTKHTSTVRRCCLTAPQLQKLEHLAE